MIDIFMFQIFFLVKEFKLALKNMEETLFLFDNKLNFYISLHFGVISIIFSKWQGINLNFILYPLIWGFVSYTFLTLLFAFLIGPSVAFSLFVLSKLVSDRGAGTPI